VVAQLRDMRSAEQSAEVAKKDEDHRLLDPEIAHPVPIAVGADQLDPFQSF
jgi:hypothetical protein